MRFIFKKINVLSLLFALAFPFSLMAAGYDKDLYFSADDIRSANEILVGKNVRLYVTVHNDSDSDLTGVVKFYNEKTGTYIGTDQPISVLSQKTDDVFVDWEPQASGNHNIAVRIVPWSEGDNPDNNKITRTFFVDTDYDGDGIGNRNDPDDDNDGVPDHQDDLPFDAKESKDTDGDGVGDNADTDDDNDGVPDARDAFPLDPKESKDTDKDGIGDNADAFPFDAKESKDIDGDGVGDNSDTDNENSGPQPSIQVKDNDIKVGEAITFSALKSFDQDGKIVDYRWNFGDGMVADGLIVDHTFKKPGEYYVTLKVTDDKGESREIQTQMVVRLNWTWFIAIGVILLILIIISQLLRPSSRFHHKKLFKRK